MKIFSFLLVGLMADDTPRHPVQRLNSLVQSSEKLLRGHFSHVPSQQNWIKMFATNAGRMERNFERGNRRCSSMGDRRRRRDVDDEDEDADDLEARFASDPCIWVRQLTNAFSKWSVNHISACSGQANYRFQVRRMVRWQKRLLEFLDCNAPNAKCDAGWHLFPDDNRCYMVQCQDYPMQYSAAGDTCARKRSFLAEIKSEDQNMAIAKKGRVGGPNMRGGIWIGGGDHDEEGSWTFGDGTAMSYFNWAKGQPDDGNPEIAQDCIWMNYMGWGVWDDMRCENIRSVYCVACTKDAAYD